MIDRRTLEAEIHEILVACPICAGRVSADAETELVELFVRKCREMYGDRDPPGGKGDRH